MKLQFELVFKCGNAKRLVYHLRDENNEQKWRFLSEKLQDVRDKQKRQNTTPQMRSFAAKIVTAQLKGWHILIGLSHFVVRWLVLRIYVFVDNSFAF